VVRAKLALAESGGRLSAGYRQAAVYGEVVVVTPLGGMQVVVTGAAGMIGSVVTRVLRDRGVHVQAHAGPPGVDPAAVPDGVRTWVADIVDSDAIRVFLRGADAVVHLAGPPSAAASFAAPLVYARAHVLGTAAVLEACREADVSRLVYMSSGEVYGQPASNPVVEDAPTLPRSPYGAAKLGGEALVRAFCPPAGITAIVLRPFSVYGPRSPEASLVGRLLKAALTENVIRLSSLKPIRDYVHVDDVSAATVAALARVAAGSPRPAVRVFNVATGVGTSVADLAALVVGTAGRSAVLEETPWPDRPAGTDVAELVADISRAAAELGWVPAVPLADGLAEALEAVRRQR
jgi:nucleoside-diphosphate-sugar epimerase